MERNVPKHRFVIKEIDYREIDREIDRGRTIHKKTVIIGNEDKKSKVVYPHPITHFIKSNFENKMKSISAQLVAARVVCRFLNFILENIENGNTEFENIKSNGFRGLNLFHGRLFISHLTLEGKQKSALILYEKYLHRFYCYLKEMNVIDESVETLIGDTYKSNSNCLSQPASRSSKEIEVLSSAKIQDCGGKQSELSAPFIQIARDIAPELALGLYFNFYGGLRKGEVVNLTRGDLNVIYRGSLEDS